MTEIITEPGYLTEFTDRLAKKHWLRGDNVRFRNGLPQKIGGSQQTSSSAFLGTARNIINFKSLALDKYLALATNARMYVFDGGDIVNVTPLRVASSTLSNPFSTSAGDATVTIADTAHGVVVGDYVEFTGATASPTDGTDMNGTHLVTVVTGANEYEIELPAVVTTTEGSFGGTVTYFYEISPGLADSTVGTGWGGATWGTGTWGTPRTGSGINLPLRTVSIDAWGEDVVWGVRGGTIYLFDTSSGIATSNRATEVTQAPDTAQYIIVSPEDRHLIALGAHDGSSDDPMLVAWCSQENLTDWVPTPLNTAGDKRLDRGTRIVTGVYARKQIAILTDTSLYSMVFIGYPQVFSITHVASRCGCIAPEAAISYNDVVYWMGRHDFFMYDGTVRIIPCTIRNTVFGDLSETQQDKIHAGVNPEFNELWWLYSSSGSTEIDRWAVYNPEGGFFFFGTFDNWGSASTARTAWVDNGLYSDNPIAAGSDGYLWVQETGTDHGSEALPYELVRAYDEISEGKHLATNTFIPDFRNVSGAMTVTMRGKRYPQDTQEYTKGPYTVTGTTNKLNIRIKAAQVSMEIAGSGLGCNMQYGSLRNATFPRSNK